MKQRQLFLLTLPAVIAIIISSCGSGKSYYSSAPRPYVSLIITPSPGFTMNSYPDGRYYHRNSQGFLYWKGYDNRFFLDKKYLSKVRYSNREYYEWKRWEQQNNKYRDRRRPY